MLEFVSGLFDTSGFVPRAQCGSWTPGLIWLHIISDLLIWIAYVSIPIILLAFARRKELPFPRVFVLFAMFILACGFVHFVEAVIFFEPIYRFSGVLKALTAAVSLMTVAALVPLVRQLFALDPGKLIALLQPRHTGGFGLRGVSVWVTSVWIAAVTVLVANTAVSSININALIYNEELITHTRAVKFELNSLLSDMKDAETGHRGFQITGKGVYLVPFFDGTKAARQRALRLEAITTDNPDQTHDAAKLKELVSFKIDEMGRMLLVHIFQGREVAHQEIGTDRGRLLMDEIRATVARMDSREDQLLAERATISKNKYRATTVTSLLGGGMALGMILLGYGLIRWELGRRLLAENVIKQREAQLARSEDQFRTLATAVPQIVWVARPDGSREYYNAKWYEYTGMTEEETLGWGWSKALHPDDKERGEARWKQSYEAGCEYEIEYRMRGADGNYRWFLGRALPQRDASGAIVRWFGSSTDITDRRMAEATIRASEERYRTLTEAIPQIVWNATPDGEVTYFNQRWLEYTQLPLEKLLEKTWLAALHPADQERVQTSWRNTIANAAVGNVDRFREELRLRRGDTGEYRWFLTVAVPLRRADGGIDQWIGSMADIHDQKTAAEVIRESEEKFRQLAESIPQLAWMTDADGYIFWYNERWYDYTGTTFQEVKGWGWQAVLDPAELSRVLTKFKGHLKSGEPWEDTFLLRRADGQMRWHLSRARPIRDDAGRVVRWFGTNTDITEQRELEEKLRAGEERFRTLTEAVPQMVWTADTGGEVTFFNRRWGEYTGTGLGTNPGEWANVVHPEDVDQLRADWQLAVAHQPERFSDEFRLKRAADGAFRWMLSTAVPLRNVEGAVTEWVGSITDIDDQKRQAENLECMVRERTAALVDEIEERRLVEQRVRAVAAELARSNAELEQFAYVASHDLQEPLRKIQAFGDRLRTKFRDDLPDVGRDYVDRMLNSAGRMRQLIDDLLSFSRVTTQSRPPVRVDLGKIVREVVSDLSVRIEQTRGEVRIGDLPEIDADPMQMRQLFQNLIANALKFQRPGVPPIVEVQSESVAAPPLEADGPSIPSCRLSVKDNGIGFDTKYLDRIFQVFQRLHGREEYEGTGVGLAICRKIAERHAGTITATSRVGEGAAFTVTLPIRQQPLAPTGGSEGQT